MNKSKLILIAVVVAAIASFFLFNLDQYFTLEYFKSQQAAIDGFYRENTALTIGLFAGIYILMAALSLPGAAVMTLIGGAIFGLLWGTVIVSFASTIGATLAFLVARFILKDSVQKRFRNQMKPINAGVERDGPLYLFMLRLVPAFPFWVINLVMALTPMKVVTFFLVSQVGMLPGTIVYVNAGTQIAGIETLGGILSLELIGAFVLLAIFPFIARAIANFVKARRAFKGWTKPKQFDRNLIVIGAGSGGLVCAVIAATVRAKVTLIEKHAMGGDCLNTGCVPSKALIRSAKFLSHVRRHREFGVEHAEATPKFGDIMARVHRVIAKIAPHDSVERFEGLGVDVIQGEAKITGPWSVSVNGRELTARHIIVATGARPFVPPVPGIDDVGYHTSDTVWSLEENPGQLIVLGGGPIGSELAQSFQRIGAQVTQFEMAERLLPIEDPEVGDMIQEKLTADGVDVRTSYRVVRFAVEDGEKVAYAEPAGDAGESVRLVFDTLLVAVGRKPNVEGFGLEEVGVTINDAGRIDVDEYLQTRVPSIYACGDGVGKYQFTHTSAHEAWHATVNALFGKFKRFKIDYSVMPHSTFTDPEVARVGLSEREATDEGIDYQVTRYDLAELDRAIADEEDYGMVKILTEAGKDKIIGATIVGDHAGDLLAELTLAMKHGIGLNKILGTIHPYPTLAEANKFAAGEWKKANAPERVLGWLEHLHRWSRGSSRGGAESADEPSK